MPVTMFDRSGKAVEVAEDQALTAYRSGELGFAKGTTLPIVTEGGVVDTPVDQIDLSAPVNPTIETTADREARLQAEQYGGFGQKAIGATEEALSGATLGLSDVAAGAIGGDDWRAAREKRAAELGMGRTVANIGGALLPALLTGGESLVATGARAAPSVLASEGAALAGRGARAGLGALGVTGESLVGRAALRGAEYGVAGAAEGAAYGAGNALSEAALAPGGDYDNLASKLASGAKSGAYAGGLLGGVGGAVAGAGSKALERFGVRGAAGEISDLAAIRAVDPSKKAARELVNTGRSKLVAKELLENDVIQIGATKGDMLERAEQVREAAGKKIGDMFERLDAAGARVNATPIFEGIETLKAGYAGHLDPNIARIADQIEARTANVAARGENLTFGELQRFRTDIDKGVNWATTTKAENEAWKKLRGIVETEIETQAPKAIEAIGGAGAGNALAAYKAAKDTYGAMTWATNSLRDNLARGQANQVFGLTEKIAGAAGFSGELAHAGAHAVMHGVPGAMVASAATGLAAKAFREYGAGAIAVLARRVATADSKIDGAIARFVQRSKLATRIKSVGLGNLVGRSPIDMVLARKKGETRERAYAQRIEQVRRSDPSQTIGTIASSAPKTAVAIVARATRAKQHLLANAPTPPLDTDVIMPHQVEPMPDPVALSQWARRLQIAEDPASILHELDAGTITPEHVEALKEIDPSFYEDLKQRVLSSIADAKEPLDYDRRINLGILFDVPTDPSLKPEQIAAVQASYQAPEPPAEPPPQPMTTRSKARTELQRLEAGDMTY